MTEELQADTTTICDFRCRLDAVIKEDGSATVRLAHEANNIEKNYVRNGNI